MKKAICVLLTGIMVCITACGSQTDGGSKQSDVNEAVSEGNEASSDTANEDTTKENTGETSESGENPDAEESDSDVLADEDTAATEETKKSLADVPGFVTVTDYDSEYDEIEGEFTALFEGHDEELLLLPEYAQKYSQLDKSLWALYEKNHNLFLSTAEEYKTSVKSDVEGGYFFAGYTLDQDIMIKRLDRKILSFCENDSIYMGGAHGSFGITSHNFDVETGVELKLSDVINLDEKALNEILLQKITAYYDELREPGYIESFADPKETLASYSYTATDEDWDYESEDNKYPYTWYLTNDGLHVSFGLYTFASYADGLTDVFIGYDEMPEIFNKQYLPGSDDVAFITDLGGLWETDIDIDGDGVSEKLTADYIYENDDYEWPVGITLDVDGTTAKCQEDYFYVDGTMKTYHVRTSDNRNYIWFRTGGMDDYWSWSVFDLNNDTVKYVGTVSFSEPYVELKNDEIGGRVCKTDPNNISFGERTDCLGTFTVYTSWHVGADGLPEVNDPRRTANYYGDGVVSKSDMTLDVVDENGNILEEGVTISAGETFVPYVTDLDSYMDCKLRDGRIVRLKYTDLNGFPATIDGKSIEELFDNVMYAG